MNKIFPKLYEQASTGKIKHWTISVIDMPDKELPQAIILVKYGIDNSKIRVSEKIVSTGKNIGRSNETTPYEQALLEAEATWKQKKDKGYVKNVANLNDEKLLPMLAHTFQKRGHDIVYPCYVQPKLDGVRCLAKKIDDKTIKYYSRAGKEFTTLEHLTPDLLKLMKVDQVLDGEIYSHNYTFQEAISYLKKLRPESKTLEYYVFDLVDITKGFEKRLMDLRNIFKLKKLWKIKNEYICKVNTHCIDSKKQIPKALTAYLKQGYEGVILRNQYGMYALKKRSKDLQKYKEFQDEEFEITGGQEGTGTEVGCIIFTVKNKKGQEFAVRPRGSFELRKQWMKELPNLIGENLTVRFQGISDIGIPRFPVGICLRDYEG